MTSGIFFSDQFEQFDLGPSHPMNKNRMISAWKLFKDIGFKDTTIYSPTPANEEAIETVHAVDYVEEVKKLSKQALKSDNLFSRSDKASMV